MRVAGDAIAGATLSAIGGNISSDFASSKLLSWTKNIPGKAVSNMLDMGISNGISGFIVGSVQGYMASGDLKTSLKTGLNSALFGLSTGALYGTLGGWKEAYLNNESPWTGESRLKTDLSNGDFSVYVGKDIDTKEVKYVGMTGRDPEVRIKEHQSSGTERAFLKYEVPYKLPSKIEARIQEQILINQYDLNNLYNKINSIAPKYWEKYHIKP
jgi:hypothetical protein